MIINKIKKSKSASSTVLIDDKELKIANIIIAKYNLYEDLEISNSIYYKIINDNEKELGYNYAISYLSRYVKSEEEVIKYLKGKKLKKSNIDEAIKRLRENKILNDDKTIDAIIFSLILGKNGKNMIKYKLFQKGFDEKLINEKLNNIDMELYLDTLAELYKKCQKKYDKYDEYTKIHKIKDYLISRGYTISDVDSLDI